MPFPAICPQILPEQQNLLDHNRCRTHILLPRGGLGGCAEVGLEAGIDSVQLLFKQRSHRSQVEQVSDQKQLVRGQKVDSVAGDRGQGMGPLRSEERRVGKECL